MSRKSKPSRKSAIRSTKAKNAVARKPAKSAKSAGGRLNPRFKKSSKKSTGRTTTQSLDKTVDRCVATLDGLRKQCVAKVRRLVRAGRSYFRTNRRIRTTSKRRVK
jgi:hypothetical protein